MPIQSEDTSGNPFAIVYSGPGETWKILKGVVVSGVAGGISSDYAGSILVNKGSVVGAGGIGVTFDAHDAPGAFVIRNKGSGDIVGTQTGIVAIDLRDSFRLQNDGTIEGESGGVYCSGSSDIMIVNKGEISSAYQAVHLNINGDGAKDAIVKNYGMMEGDDTGFAMFATVEAGVKVTNYRGGTIAGDDAAIACGVRLVLKNDGTIIGRIDTSDYADKIVNRKAIKGDIYLSEGDDILKNKDKGKVTGLIDSGEGNDRIVLGDARDMLLFDSALSATANVDTIRHFESGKDALYLNEDYFGAATPGPLSLSEFHLGTSAQDADDHIIYDKASGALYYDPDGAGGAAQVQFAQLGAGTRLKASDIMVGDYTLQLPL